MVEDRQMMEENHQSLKGCLARLDQNHKRIILQLKSLDERYESYNSRVDRCLSQGSFPPRGKIFAPTFNIPVHQPPMHGVYQPPPISMARTYVASGHLGWGVDLSGGDHILSHAYQRPMPP
ncbi:hypothetical protein LINGRAHAP2_LOCUS23601 [Linum grandiflorum]